MNVWQFFGLWAIMAGPFAFLAWVGISQRDRLQRERFNGGPRLPKPQEQYIDTMIDEVLSEQEQAAAWLDHKKLVIAEVFANGEAWLDAQGNIVPKDSPAVVAHVTFNVIRAAMMKFYAAGILNMTQEDD